MSTAKRVFGYLRANNLLYELSQEKILIGREKYCDVSLSATSVSNRHAMIEFVPRDDKYVCILRDLNSTNGTTVNNVRLPSNYGKTELRRGDVLRFALDDQFYKVELNSQFVVDPAVPVTKDLSSPVLANIRDTLEEVSHTLKAQYNSCSNEKSNRGDESMYLSNLEKRVSDLNAVIWERDQEISHLRKLLETSQDRSEVTESLRRINEKLQKDIADREAEYQNLQLEVQSLKLLLKDYTTMQQKLNTFVQQNAELKLSNDQLRQQLVSTQNYSNYLHQELMKDRSNDRIPTPRLVADEVPSQMNERVNYLSEKLIEKERRIMQLEREGDQLKK